MGRRVYQAIKPMFPKDKWRILRGDLVQIVDGADKGLTGRVMRVVRDKRAPMVYVEGRNMVRRTLRMRDGQAPSVMMEVRFGFVDRGRLRGGGGGGGRGWVQGGEGMLGVAAAGQRERRQPTHHTTPHHTTPHHKSHLKTKHTRRPSTTPT